MTDPLQALAASCLSSARGPLVDPAFAFAVILRVHHGPRRKRGHCIRYQTALVDGPGPRRAAPDLHTED